MADIKLIVAGVDGSERSRAALHWACEEASHHGAAFTVVSTWHAPTLPMSPPYGSVSQHLVAHAHCPVVVVR